MMPKRILWDLALLLIGGLYILIALVANLESPIFAMTLAVLAALEIMEAHRAKH